MEQNNKERILRLQNVMNRTGDSRSSIYSKVKEGSFPKPISLGMRSVGWLESEIDAYIATLIQKSRDKKV